MRRAISHLGLILLLLVLVLSPAVKPLVGLAYAASLKELGQKKSELQQAIDAKKQEADQKKQQAAQEAKIRQQLLGVVNKLNNDITVTQGRISQTQNQINDTQTAITVQLGKIAAKEKEIENKKNDLHEAVADSYIAQQEGNALYAILADDRISSAIDQVAALENLNDKLVSDAEELDRERQDLLAAKAALEQKQQDLETQKRQLAAYQKALDNQKQQKAQLADQAKQAQIQFNDQANQAIQVASDLKKQFAAVAEEEAAMRRATSKRPGASAVRGDAPPSSYGLVWPTDGVISTYFGGQTPFQNFHTGLDVAGPAGDPVKAAVGGTVSLATKMCCSDYSNTVDHSYGYGNYVMIKHDNGLVTLYGHLQDTIVSPGDHVDRGQVLGYRGGALGMAGAGWSTGAHLHFEVRDSSGPDDPLKYLPK